MGKPETTRQLWIFFFAASLSVRRVSGLLSHRLLPSHSSLRCSMKPKNLSLSFLTVCFIICLTGLLAAAVLTNADIIKLKTAGLSDDLIISTIESSPCSFELSVDNLIKLKKAGVTEKVLQAMMEKNSDKGHSKNIPESSTPESGAIATKENRDDPMSPHRAGIYFFDGTARRFTMLYPTVYSESKSGGFFLHAMTLGVHKVKSKAVLAGASARYEIQECVPTFYFYFEVTDTTLSNSGGSQIGMGGNAAVSPNEFVLVKTDQKKDHRELIVGQFNTFGAQSGTQEKYIRTFDFDEIAPGIFKVSPRSALQSGQYAFFYGGSSTMPTFGFSNVNMAGKVFDFGVRCSSSVQN